MPTINLGRVSIVPKGTWSSSTSYKYLDLVYSGNKAYVALQASTNIVPTNTTYWMLLVDGDYSNLLSAHEAGTGVHTIAGVSGLQTVLDTLTPVNAVRVDVASASSVSLTSLTTRNINITGTTTINGFVVTSGLIYFVRFGDALTLTNSASLVTNTGANITTSSGDTCILRATGANTVEVLCYSTPTLTTRVTALEARKFTTLVPATYPSGAPHDTHETVDAALPANIAANTRYVLTNPFGVNTRVHVTVEVWVNNKWADPGFDGSTGTQDTSGGVVGYYVQGEGVVVQTGSFCVAAKSFLLGGGHGYTGTQITSAPCRVAVRKWEA